MRRNDNRQSAHRRFQKHESERFDNSSGYKESARLASLSRNAKRVQPPRETHIWIRMRHFCGEFARPDKRDLLSSPLCRGDRKIGSLVASDPPYKQEAVVALCRDPILAPRRNRIGKHHPIASSETAVDELALHALVEKGEGRPALPETRGSIQRRVTYGPPVLLDGTASVALADKALWREGAQLAFSGPGEMDKASVRTDIEEVVASDQQAWLELGAMHRRCWVKISVTNCADGKASRECRCGRSTPRQVAWCRHCKVHAQAPRRETVREVANRRERPAGRRCPKVLLRWLRR